MPAPPPPQPQPAASSSSSRSRSQPSLSEGGHEGDEERQRRKNVMDALVRKEQLEADPWASEVKETSVRCKGCRKVIKLDGRYQYYRGLWDKHRDTCRDIKRLKGEKIPKVCFFFLFASRRRSRTIKGFDFFSSQLKTIIRLSLLCCRERGERQPRWRLPANKCSTQTTTNAPPAPQPFQTLKWSSVEPTLNLGNPTHGATAVESVKALVHHHQAGMIAGAGTYQRTHNAQFSLGSTPS